MSRPFLSVLVLGRRLSNGNTESLVLQLGVNLLVGPPNTGKTKWLQTLDYLLGDTGDNPYEGDEETGLSDKYDAAWTKLKIGDDVLHVERRWREKGAKGKVFVDDVGMSAPEFQQFLLERLKIPLLNFPKGNPMSGQTWPELSFRVLLRHIYRQQRFWGGIADLQPEAEQHAATLQFLGLAENLFAAEYGDLIGLKLDVARLKARREQYDETLKGLARDLVSELDLTVGLSEATVAAAKSRVQAEVADLIAQRSEVIIKARTAAVAPERQKAIEALGERRATAIAALEAQKLRTAETTDRMKEMRQYRNNLSDELERISRAEDAGEVLADLKITHCPACDQTISHSSHSSHECFLCHQELHSSEFTAELGAARLTFERERIGGELKEIEELVDVLGLELKKLENESENISEEIDTVERQLAPARAAVASLVQTEISAIDMGLGELSERQRQLGRVSLALQVGADLTAQIQTLEREIVPLQRRVDDLSRSVDFDAASDQLADGMNFYLSELNRLRPGVWKHNYVTVDVSKSRTVLRVGSRGWQAALGGTDTLYFLMAYHFGLLNLSGFDTSHYPGLSIIDLPGEFLGELVADKENYIVQPFIALLTKERFAGAQVIITGASFAGIEGATVHQQRHVWVS